MSESTEASYCAGAARQNARLLSELARAAGRTRSQASRAQAPHPQPESESEMSVALVRVPASHLHPKLDVGSFESFRIRAENAFRAMADDKPFREAIEAVKGLQALMRGLYRAGRRKPRGIRRHIRRAKAAR